jgi:hypothetical protein
MGGQRNKTKWEARHTRSRQSELFAWSLKTMFLADPLSIPLFKKRGWGKLPWVVARRWESKTQGEGGIVSHRIKFFRAIFGAEPVKPGMQNVLVRISGDLRWPSKTIPKALSIHACKTRLNVLCYPRCTSALADLSCHAPYCFRSSELLQSLRGVCTRNTVICRHLFWKPACSLWGGISHFVFYIFSCKKTAMDQNSRHRHSMRIWNISGESCWSCRIQ